MKKLIYFIVFLIICIGCTCTKNSQQVTWPESDTTQVMTRVMSSPRMYFDYNGKYCNYQIDSMIIADTLAPLSRWHKTTTIRTTEPIVQYAFIKENYDSQMIYTVTKMHLCDTIYLCTKKVTIK